MVADLVVAVFLSVALMLTLPASPWQKLAPSGVDAFDASGTVRVDLDPSRDPLPSDGVDGPGYQTIQLFEDDVLHEDHVCLAPVLQLKVTQVTLLEPDSPHTSRLERPPMRAV